MPWRAKVVGFHILNHRLDRELVSGTLANPFHSAIGASYFIGTSRKVSEIRAEWGRGSAIAVYVRPDVMAHLVPDDVE